MHEYRSLEDVLMKLISTRACRPLKPLIILASFCQNWLLLQLVVLLNICNHLAFGRQQRPHPPGARRIFSAVSAPSSDKLAVANATLRFQRGCGQFLLIDQQQTQVYIFGRTLLQNLRGQHHAGDAHAHVGIEGGQVGSGDDQSRLQV